MTSEPTTMRSILWDLVLEARQLHEMPMGQYPALTDAIERARRRIEDHIIDLIRRPSGLPNLDDLDDEPMRPGQCGGHP